ncbi:hypothetical protein ACJX0J_031243, partial [Zea mays]
MTIVALLILIISSNLSLCNIAVFFWTIISFNLFSYINIICLLPKLFNKIGTNYRFTCHECSMSAIFKFRKNVYISIYYMFYENWTMIVHHIYLLIHIDIVLTLSLVINIIIVLGQFSEYLFEQMNWDENIQLYHTKNSKEYNNAIALTLEVSMTANFHLLSYVPVHTNHHLSVSSWFMLTYELQYPFL